MSDISFSHQDWKPVVITNPKIQKKKKEEDGVVVRKVSSGAVEGQKGIDGEDYVPKKFDKQFGSLVSAKRAEMKMTQDDLAKKLCVGKNLIRDIEKGSAVYNPKIMVDICKVLGIKK